MLTHRMRVGILIGMSLSAVLAVFAHGPIAQDPAYHGFADARQIAGVFNFWNVVSNLPFVIVGIVGLVRYPRITSQVFREAYLALCAGVLLIGLGSGYYHFAPSNATLIWDRLPMTVALMAFLSLLLSERVLGRPSRKLLWLLIGTGIVSVLYWGWSESVGRGDLRPYVLVQFLPLALIPLVLLMFRQRYIHSGLLLAALGLYAAAKLLEHFDASIMAATGSMGGHAIKHLAASAAIACIVYSLPVARR